jgi:mannose-6-phosphate isomerase-like protein (cupin superfamily)
MSGYTVARREDAPDFMSRWPGYGEMRLLTEPLQAEQVALTWRSMPEKTGGKGGYGHRHRTQEEVYFVLSGKLQLKLDDDVVEVGPGTAVRVAPQVVRSAWNEGPGDAELVIVSAKVDDPEADSVQVEDFWPVD